MINQRDFELPEISKEDIHWACKHLDLPDHAFYGENGNDPRQSVLMSNDTMDVSACPGSGKTTLLVAKLAILAKKWKYRTRGICTLSHTNAARHEVETRLSNTAVGKYLLSYPHFIGTIHKFVNDFLAIPWLRSLGYSIKMIDSNIVHNRRWNSLHNKSRYALKQRHLTKTRLSVKTPCFDLGEINGIGKCKDTYIDMHNVCKKSIEEGYYCYEEMFMWARDFIDKTPWITNIIRERFPILFIDEAQDNSEDQSDLLFRIFMEGDNPVLRQRFGDNNQAIYDFYKAKGATTDVFPDDLVKNDLPNSHRFGQKIADLADPLGVRPYGLKGHGPKDKQVKDGEAKHTIFIFKNDDTTEVLDSYANLIIDTFDLEYIKKGIFVAAGFIHNPPDSLDPKKHPQFVGNYWRRYDPHVGRPDAKPITFVQYLIDGQARSCKIGESYPAVEGIAEGIIRLADVNITGNRRLMHRHILLQLEQNSCALESYHNLLDTFVISMETPTKEHWESRWRSVVKEIAKSLKDDSCSELPEDVNDFLEWPDNILPPHVSEKEKFSSNNVYRGPKENPIVDIRVGSIHSIKGETHTATLVLETFWYKHNLKSIIDWLCRDRYGYDDGIKDKNNQNKRLKINYVAMTRPTHLLCLAMRRQSFENSSGELDSDLIGKFESYGWHIKVI